MLRLVRCSSVLQGRVSLKHPFVLSRRGFVKKHNTGGKVPIYFLFQNRFDALCSNADQPIPLSKETFFFEDIWRELISRQPLDRNGLDVFLYQCQEHAALVQDKLLEEIVHFYQMQMSTGNYPNESSLASLVNVLVAKGRVQQGIQLIKDTQIYCPQMKVKLRTYSSTFRYLCQDDQVNDVISLWNEIKDKIFFGEEEFIQFIAFILRNKLDENSGLLVEVLTYMHNNLCTITSRGATQLQKIFQDNDWSVESSHINDEGHCKCCGEKLHKLEITPDEYNSLENSIQSVYSQCSMDNFSKWIKDREVMARRIKNGAKDSEKKLHVFIDGPNVAYTNQNFGNGKFRFDQIDTIVKYLERVGHNVTVILPSLYLSNYGVQYSVSKMKTKKRITSKTRGLITKKDKDIINSWRNKNMLYTTAQNITDDFFWLYASFVLKEKCRVVSNDQIRDHTFAMLENSESSTHSISRDLIIRWKESTLIKFTIHENQKPAKFNLFFPAPYSTTIQHKTTGKKLFVHLPILDKDNTPDDTTTKVETKWLCVSK